MTSSGLDVVTICTRTRYTSPACSLRHVTGCTYSEKPVAVHLDEVRRMIAATNAAGVTFGVLFQRRFWPAAARIRSALDDGRLGRAVAGNLTMRFNRDAAYYSESWRGRWDTEGRGALINQSSSSSCSSGMWGRRCG